MKLSNNQLLLIYIAFISLHSCKEHTDKKQPLPTPVAVDTIKTPNAEYAQNIYNPETKTYNLSYNYSNKWDIDDDGKKDSILFIGNGGAHAYFYLSLITSADKLKRDFTTVNIDMPYLSTKAELDKHGKSPAIQFTVDDFDKDGIPDIYLNFNDADNAIPTQWQKAGVRTKYVLLSFHQNRLVVKDY